jgi:dTDP-4-dehydrorhamnose reductase
VVNDQRGCPSYTLDIAAALVGLCQKGVRGTVHVTNSGEATWFDFAVAIISRAGLKDVRVEPITTAELGRPAPRPAYSVLDNSRFVSIMGAPLRRWETALDHYLLRRVQRRSTPK